MTSNLFSRLIPQSTTPSIYDTLRAAEQSDESDVEERAGLNRDDFSDDIHFAGYDQRGPPLRQDSADSDVPFRDVSPVHLRSASSRRSDRSSRSPEWRRARGKATEEDEANDDVPLSLLVEDESPEVSPLDYKRLPPRPSDEPDYIPVDDRPGTGTDGLSVGGRDPHHDQSRRPAYTGRPFAGNPLLLASEREKAMYRWTNVTDLDRFLLQVYEYYLGRGIYSILLGRMISQLTIAFVVGFSLFLTTCINYGKIPGSEKTSDILIEKCTQRMSTFKYVVVAVATFAWFWRTALVLLDTRRLWHMKCFFTYLLDIPESDIQTVNWQQVVARLMTLRDQNVNTANINTQRARRFIGTQSKQRMDAHDIANRLMRRENYMIALMNKDILDLKVRIPYFGDYYVFTKSVEWSIKFGILDFVFDSRNQVNPMFLGSSKRAMLSEGLQRRFRTSAFIHLAVAPFTIVYMTMEFFFRYFQEYQKNPGRLGVRQYTPLAEWKFREFNELEHMLDRRLKLSHNIANVYLNHWPKDKTVQVARFVGLIAGALASVLVLATLWDPDSFLDFKITPNRTALFYTGVLVAVWGAARNVEPDDTENALPDEAMEVVCNFTHYRPPHWEGKLHSDEVRKDFSGLYQVKLVIFLEELLSVILFPFILYFNLPACSNRIVDFFREFTVHVDGLGYICSFALFDFKNGGRPDGEAIGGGKGDPRDEYYATKDNKMMSSYMHFMDAYHHDPTGRKNMAQLAHFHATHRNRQFHPPPAFPGMNMGTSQVMATGAAPIERSISPLAERRPTGGTATSGFRSRRMPSPQASMLLDPAHQPLSHTATFRSGIGAGGRSTVQSHHQQLRKSRLARRGDIIGEEDENVPVARSGSGRGKSSSGAPPIADSQATSAAHDDLASGLGGSWKATGAGQLDGEDDDEDDGGLARVMGTAANDPAFDDVHAEGGMLGLIKQFSKAQARGGVQI